MEQNLTDEITEKHYDIVERPLSLNLSFLSNQNLIFFNQSKFNIF